MLAAVTDEPRWDAAGSLAIGILLVVIAIFLAIEMASLLVGEAATPEDIAKIRGAIESHPCVVRIIHLRTEHIGPDDIMVATKVEFDHGMTIEQLADEIDAVEARVRDGSPDHPPHLHRARRLPRLTPGFGDIWRPFRSPIVARTCVQAGMSSGRRVLRSAVVASGASASRVA